MTGMLWISLGSSVTCLLFGLVVGWWMTRWKNSKEELPAFVDVGHQRYALDTAISYLTYYRSEFVNRRRAVKRRAWIAVVATATFNAGIAVVGAVVTLTRWSRLGIVSTVLAGAVAVVAAWDGHFRHRDLWVQRSLILQQLEQALRDAEINKRRSGAVADELAVEAMSTLDRVLKRTSTAGQAFEKLTRLAGLIHERAQVVKPVQRRRRPTMSPRVVNPIVQ